MHKDEVKKHKRVGEDWILAYDSINPLPPVNIRPKLLKATFPQDLEYKYCIEEVTESDPVELFVDEAENEPASPFIPIDLFQNHDPANKKQRVLVADDQFLLTRYTNSRESDPRPFLENKLFLSRRPVTGHETRIQAKVSNSSEARYISKPFAPGKHSAAGSQVVEDPESQADHGRDANQIIITIERLFQDANKIDLQTLEHPTNLQLKAVAMHDLLPLNSANDSIKRSLLSFDTDFVPGRNVQADGAPPSKVNTGGSLLIKVVKRNPSDALYSQYTLSSSNPELKEPSSSGESREIIKIANYEWVKNYETTFFATPDAKLALVSLPDGNSPHGAIVPIGKIAQRIGLKRKRTIAGSGSENNSAAKRIRTAFKTASYTE